MSLLEQLVRCVNIVNIFIRLKYNLLVDVKEAKLSF
jgi:hypothetical protein